MLVSDLSVSGRSARRLREKTAQQSFKISLKRFLTFQRAARKRFVRCGRNFPANFAPAQILAVQPAKNARKCRQIAELGGVGQQNYNGFCAAMQNHL